MDSRFDKYLLVAVVISIAAVIIIGSADANSELVNQYPGIMRFHVIANSDTEEDQNLKLQVRDYVLPLLQEALAEEMTNIQMTVGNTQNEGEILRAYINNNLDLVQSWTNDALKLYKSDYSCEVSVEIRHIPAKCYDNLYFPEGNYEALTITIGEGRGQNWWCVVFPPLCLVDSEDSPYADSLDISEEEKIQLKSKIVELLEKNSASNSSINSISKGIYAIKCIDALLCIFKRTQVFFW